MGPPTPRAEAESALRGPDRPRRVQAMFDRIVPRYDLMNRLMTAGMDGPWRRRAARAARPAGACVLDLATGTGDLARELTHLGARCVVGADFSGEMLRAARDKLTPAHAGSPGHRAIISGSFPADDGPTRLHLVSADALALPFQDCAFDALTSAFLLRNVADLPRALREMHRVVRPGGRVVALELTHSRSGPLEPVFAFYFSQVVPRLGRAITGDPWAYTYLPASLDPFPAADQLRAMFRAAGFPKVTYRLMGLGHVALHVAEA